MIDHFIERYEKGEITEETVEQMRHFAFEANDDELFMVAQIFAALGMAGQAVELVEPLYEKYPHEQPLKNFLADLYLDLAEDAKALELLNGNDEGADVKNLLLQADMYLAQGLFEVAEEKLKQAVALEPDNELLDLAYAEYYFHIGAFEEAIPLYLDFVDGGLDVELNLYERLGTCYSQVGQFEKALEQYENSEKFYGEPSTEQLFQKAFLAHRLGDGAMAKAALLKIRDLDESYDTIYPMLGEIFLKEGDLERALSYVLEGIRHNEYNPGLYRIKGEILKAKKDWEGARDAYYEVLNLDPEDLDAALKSNRICLFMEDYEEVVSNIAHYEENGLVDDRFFWDLAICHMELENYDEALQNFEKGLAAFSDHADFLFDYAQFLMGEGRTKEAIVRLNRVLEVDPSAYAAQELLENLTEI